MSLYVRALSSSPVLTSAHETLTKLFQREVIFAEHEDEYDITDEILKQMNTTYAAATAPAK